LPEQGGCSGAGFAESARSDDIGIKISVNRSVVFELSAVIYGGCTAEKAVSSRIVAKQEFSCVNLHISRKSVLCAGYIQGFAAGFPQNAAAGKYCAEIAFDIGLINKFFAFCDFGCAAEVFIIVRIAYEKDFSVGNGCFSVKSAVVARYCEGCGAGFQEIACSGKRAGCKRIIDSEFEFKCAAVVDCGDAAEVGIGCSGFVEEDFACFDICRPCEAGVFAFE